MRKSILLILTLFFTVGLFAQDKKIAEKISPISSINVDGDITVELQYGDQDKIEGTIPNDQLDNFSWRVIDGSVLVVSLKSPINLGNNLPLSPIKLTIYVSKLKDIKCKRSGRIIADKTIDAKVLTIDASRNSVVSLPIKCFDMTVHCSFGSVVTLKGEAEFLVVNSSYSGNVDCKELNSVSSTVTASTASEVAVKASKKLLLTAKTNAVISYKKSEAVVTKFESTLGKVIETE